MTVECGEESEEGEDPDLAEQFTFASWTGPKFIFKKVHQWAVKDWNQSSKGSIGSFLQYCWAFCEDEREEDEMFMWMLSLISLYVKEDGWVGFCHGALKWDWSQLAVRDHWEIPAPEWAKNREEEDILNGFMMNEEEVVKEDVVKENVVKEDVVKEEDVNEEDVKKDCVKQDDVKEDEMKEDEMKEDEMKEDEMREDEMKEDEMKEDEVKKGEMRKVVVKNDDEECKKEDSGKAAFPSSSWGSQLPPASPLSTKPLPTWRPWEVDNNEGSKVKLPRCKKRSPASKARSVQRLREWQQRRDLQRCSTPLPPRRELFNARLTDRLEGKFGSQTSPVGKMSCSQTSSPSPFWSGSQSFSSSPSSPRLSGS